VTKFCAPVVNDTMRGTGISNAQVEPQVGNS